MRAAKAEETPFLSLVYVAEPRSSLPCCGSNVVIGERLDSTRNDGRTRHGQPQVVLALEVVLPAGTLHQHIVFVAVELDSLTSARSHIS